MGMRMNGQQSLSRHETPTREKEERAGQSRMENKADRERPGQRGRGFSRHKPPTPGGLLAFWLVRALWTTGAGGRRSGVDCITAGQGVVSLAPLNPDRGYARVGVRGYVRAWEGVPLGVG